MTLAINISHGSPGYPAKAHINASSVSPATVVDGAPASVAWIHSGKSAVVHEVGTTEDVGHAEERALRRMWSAYSFKAGGKTFDGKPLPTWDELGEERQACWRAALHAL